MEFARSSKAILAVDKVSVLSNVPLSFKRNKIDERLTLTRVLDDFSSRVIDSDEDGSSTSVGASDAGSVVSIEPLVNVCMIQS